jgi:hypothetical protein
MSGSVSNRTTAEMRNLLRNLPFDMEKIPDGRGNLQFKV